MRSAQKKLQPKKWQPSGVMAKNVSYFRIFRKNIEVFKKKTHFWNKF